MAHNPGDLPHEDPVGSNKWFWADGTPVTPEEDAELKGQASGSAPNPASGIDTAVHGTTDLYGISQPLSGAPGASLNTSLADQQNDQLGSLLASLQQQAATGSGSWENALKEATQRSQATASALGQSDPSSGYQSSLVNIGNAQSGASQRAAGQGEILRNQSKMAAQDQLGDLIGSMGSTDIEQSAAAARAKQQRRATDASLQAEAHKQTMGTIGGVAQAIPYVGGAAKAAAGPSGMSDGGRVPGTPKIFGNDSRNDTKPAMLTPGEIVVDLEHTKTPEMAARRAFEIALKQQGPQRMADGGTAGWREGDVDPTASSGPNWAGVATEAPSMENGALLDTSQYDKTRAARTGLQAQLAQRAAGGGPSVVPQMATNANDAAIAQAMQARRGGGSSVAAATQAAQSGAGDAAAMKATEQQRGQNAAAGVGTRARGQELQLAEAQQQALWANTMSNAGISLQNQAALRGLFSGAGQALTTASGLGGNKPTSTPSNTPDFRDPSGTRADEIGGRGGPTDLGHGDSGGGWDEGSDPSEWDLPQFAGGGMVEGRLPRMPQPKDRTRVDVKLGDLTLAPVPETREQRKAAEYEEETGESAYAARKAAEHEEEADGPAPAKTAKPANKSLAQKLADFAQNAASKVGHFADGGQVDDFPARRDFGPQVFTTQDGAFDAPTGLPLTQNGVELPLVFDGNAQEAAATRSRWNAPPGADPLLGPSLSAPAIGARQTADAAKSREALGVTPRDAAPTTEAAVPPVAQPAPRTGSGVALPPSRTLEQGFANSDAMLANEQMGAAQVGAAEAEVKGIEARERAMQTAEIDRKQTQERARMRTTDAMAKWTAAQDEFNRIDTTVDPGRYWANQNTGQKILGIIGLALGAAGAGPDGINRSAQLMNQAIDRDLAAQREAAEMRLKKGAQRLQGAQNYYEMARAAGLDDMAAFEASKGAALGFAALQAERMAAATKPAVAKATYQMLGSAMRQSQADQNQKAEQLTFENQLKRQHLANETNAAQAKGSSLPATEQSKALEVKERSSNIRSNIAKAKAIIQRSGTMELTGTEQTELERAIGDIAQDSARLKDPNSTVKDQELINAKRAIGVEGGEVFTRNSTAVKLLDSFEKSMNEREKEALRVRGLQ